MFEDTTIKAAEALGIDIEKLSGADEDGLDALIAELESAGETEARKGVFQKLIDAVKGAGKAKDASKDADPVEDAPNDGNADATPAFVTLEQLEARLAAERESATKAARAEASKEAAVKAADTAIDTAVASKRLIPATAELLRPIVAKLAADGHTVTRKSEDGDKTVNSVEALIEAVSSQTVINETFFQEKSAAGAGADDNPWAEANFKA